MKSTCSLILVVWLFTGVAIAQETAPSTRDPEAAQKLFDLPEASQQEYARLEGSWELMQDTDAPDIVRRVKTHHNRKTTVLAYDDAGNIVSQHNSEYQLKQAGMARIFVYFNVVPTTGPSKGHELPGPFYYACHVQGNRFVEVYGILAGDDRSPRMLHWKRVED